MDESHTSIGKRLDWALTVAGKGANGTAKRALSVRLEPSKSGTLRNALSNTRDHNSDSEDEAGKRGGE